MAEKEKQHYLQLRQCFQGQLAELNEEDALSLGIARSLAATPHAVRLVTPPRRWAGYLPGDLVHLAAIWCPLVLRSDGSMDALSHDATPHCGSDTPSPVAPQVWLEHAMERWLWHANHLVMVSVPRSVTTSELH